MRKPILILGIGLSIGLGVWDFFQHSIFPLGDYSLVGAIALGFLFWSWSKKNQIATATPIISTIEQKTVEEAIAQAQTTIKYLETEASEEDFSYLNREIELITNSLERKNLQVNITGNKRVGKTTLTQLLFQQNQDSDINYFDTEKSQVNADLIIFLLNGDLTASEAEIIGQCQQLQQKILVVLNKKDQYTSEERSEILYQIKISLQEIISSNDIFSIATAPNPIKVKKYLQDGKISEQIEAQNPDIKQLDARLKEIIKQEKKQLILATAWRQAKLLEKQAKKSLNKIRNNRSQPIIEQYQWLAATAAFANPVSALDLLATAAINGQMLVDLATIYQQKISLDQAQRAAVTIGKVMVKLGIVELSTQAIASILKSNAFTYIAGGIVQGISAAYLTRIAGLSLIAYYEELEIAHQSQENLNLDKLTDKIKAIFTDNQKVNLLQNFVTQALNNKQLKLTNS